LSLGPRDRVEAAIAVSNPGEARTVVWTLESVFASAGSS